MAGWIQTTGEISRRTGGPGLSEVTTDIREWLGQSGAQTGLLTLYLRHTSASLLIQENADPDVQKDLDDFFRNLVPRDSSRYRHNAEGPDDMPAHIRTALTQTHVSIPVEGGRMALGTWQGIYLYEHRDRPHDRHIRLHFIGTGNQKG